MSIRSDTDLLSIIWSCSGGSEGSDKAQDNPIARATRRLWADGQPFERINFTFFSSPPGPLRWFGIFVHSAGDRILFFPGFREPQSGVQKYRQSSLVETSNFDVDHATLEKDRRSWHLKSTNRAASTNVPSTVDLGNSRVLWFGLSMASPQAMRLLHNQTVVEAWVPPTDGRRRADVLHAARKDAEFNVLSLNTSHEHSFLDRFLHFTVVVGPPDFPEYKGPHFAFPYGSPYLKKELPDPLTNVPIRTHRIRLSRSVDIQITATLLPGSMTVPMALCTPAN